MKLLLLAAAIAFSMMSATPPGAMAAESKTLQPNAEQKVVHDPKEFKAYMDAVRTKDPAARGAAMEQFVARYPHSTVLAEALEQAMSAYQAAGNGAKVAETAARLVKIDPKNVQALAILTFAKMNEGTPAAVGEAKGLAERGLKLLPGWKSAPGVPKAQFAAMRRETSAVFYDAIGLADLYVKDYAAARDPLRRSLEIKNGTFVENYRLAVAELEMKPTDPEGFWYIAKSIDLARSENPDAAGKIEPYGSEKYRTYHGSMDGWDALLLRVAREKAPPKRFTVTAAPAK
jgi:tetratricopeptide (TPR) repeat protein